MKTFSESNYPDQNILLQENKTIIKSFMILK